MSSIALSLAARGLSFAYSDAVPLLEDADFHLTPGWVGLVGANGAGKTTLLRLIAGELAPERGHLRVDPPGAAAVTCPQTVDRRTDAIARFAGAGDALARRLRGQLGLDAGELERWETLSPGERKRWQIGAALAAAPEILLLDEPTNHLDAPARGLLIEALRQFRGIGVVVSHDRELLEGLTRGTLRVHRGEARLFRGSYEVARREWEAEENAQLEAHRRLRDEQRAMERRLDEARRDHAATQADLSSKRRMKNKRDHDASSMGAKFRVEQAEKRLGKNVGVVRRAAERVAEEASSIHIEKTLGRSVFVDYAPSPSPRLFALDAPCVRAGGAEVLGEVHLAVDRASRVRIEGPNGAGKTTLVKALLASARVPASKILYVPQDTSPGEERALLDEARRLPPVERGRVMSVVAALGVDPGRLLSSAHPSPGEARKLMVALGLGRHVWALVLDEPTNHMDLPSIERLERALDEYPGALVLVTHDRAFGRRATDTVWRLERGEVAVRSEPRGAPPRVARGRNNSFPTARR